MWGILEVTNISKSLNGHVDYGSRDMTAFRIGDPEDCRDLPSL